MYELRIELILKEHPHQNQAGPGTYLEAWGGISMNLHNTANVKNLIQLEWDALCLAEWFVDNKVVIAVEDFLILGEKTNPGESIAEAMHRIGLQKFSLPFQSPDAIIDQEMAIYDTYYLRHSPYRDMIGSGMPEILIGLNHGSGEVSLLNAAQNWKYPFDMKIFMKDFSREIEEFVSEWLSKNQNQDAIERGLTIIEKLKSVV